MKLLKVLLKFAIVFIVIFGVYTLIYHYRVESTSKVDLSGTFIPSEKNIAKLEDMQSESSGTQIDNLTENSIDKSGFYIRIDRIGLFKPVVKNVDPRYKDEYTQSWEKGVSHGKFTALPDQIGNVYLFAHAVSDESDIDRENAWFTKTDELVENDKIIIYFQNKKYVYQVSNIYAVSPTATGVYTGVSPVSKVTLQTCGPPRGSLDSRYMVEALQISSTDFI